MVEEFGRPNESTCCVIRAGWIPQTKLILLICLADTVKRCLCKLTVASCRIFVYRLWHLRGLWCTQLFHPDEKQTERHCDSTVHNVLDRFWFNTFHFNGFLLQQVFNANIALCARPATNTAKKMQNISGPNGTSTTWPGLARDPLSQKLHSSEQIWPLALSPLILLTALSTLVTKWRPLSVNQLRRDHLVLMGLLQLDPLSIQQWALQRYSPMWQNVTSEN